MNAQVQLSSKDRAGRKTDKYVSQKIFTVGDQELTGYYVVKE